MIEGIHYAKTDTRGRLYLPQECRDHLTLTEGLYVKIEMVDDKKKALLITVVED